MSRATGTLKYTLFIFNTLWTILGIVVIVFGGLSWNGIPPEYSIGLIVLGGVILLISFFGCCGAIRESARMMWTYAVLLLILLIAIVAFLCLSTPDVFKKYAMQMVEDTWRQEQQVHGAMDKLQSTYSCCGRDGAEDYLRIGRTPPASCCRDGNCINPLNLFVIGCLERAEMDFADEAYTTKIWEYSLLGFDLLILVLATILAIHYTNRRRRYNY